MKKNLVAGGANNVKDSIYCIDMGENFLIIDIENLNKKIISKKQIKDKKNILKMYASATKQKKQIKAMAIVPFFSKFANKSEFIYKTALLYLTPNGH